MFRKAKNKLCRLYVRLRKLRNEEFDFRFCYDESISYVPTFREWLKISTEKEAFSAMLKVPTVDVAFSAMLKIPTVDVAFFLSG